LCFCSAWLWAKHEWFLGRITVLMLAQAIYYMIKYALGYVENLERALDIAMSQYKGVSAELLRAQTRAWFLDEVLPRTRPLARSTLARHRAAGERCVLASSTTHFAAEAAREAFGLNDAVCTKLEIDAAGLLTGRATALAFGRGKAARVREWAERHGVPLSRCTFYTDSFADAALLAQVGTPVCVNPDRRLRALAKQQGWPCEDWGRSPEPIIKLRLVK
jgi:HAD superfamily hydrolase (TIGR01490 family)